MRTTLVQSIQIAALILLFVCVAQQPKLEAGQRPQLTNDDLETRNARLSGVAADDYSFALLPPSDLVAVVELSRLLAGLLPQLKEMAPGEVGQVIAKLEQLRDKTGIDLSHIERAVIGLKLPDQLSKNGRGVIIIQGLELDSQKLAAWLETERWGIKSLDYQGRPLSLIAKPREKAPAGKSSGLELEEVALARLDQQSVVLGDLESVKSVLEAQARTTHSEVNALLASMLKNTNPEGWVRFAALIPESFHQQLAQLGDFLRPLAAVRACSGSLAFGPADESATVELKMSTSTADEAERLENWLKELISMGKALLSSGQEPSLKLIRQLIDQIQLSTQSTEVSLSISVPQELLKTFKKSGKPPAETSKP